LGKSMGIPAVIYRGGTSKAIFLKEYDLPKDAKERNRMILKIFGSPDKRQIDGLGGADPLTSKLAIIGPPTRPDADVDYTFGQVSIDSTDIHYGAVCGNVSAAVGPFAIEEGYVWPTDPVTAVRIHCTNNGRIIRAWVPVRGNRVIVEGDFVIDGVPGKGARIELDWSDLVGANTGRLLPTGNVCDELYVEGVGNIRVSIIDVGNPGVFVNAADLGLKGTETSDEIDGNTDLIKKSEAIMMSAMGKINSIALLTYVSPSADYLDFSTGRTVSADQTDFLVRMIFMGKTHKAYAASMINCCGAAAMIPGTIVNRVAKPEITDRKVVRMGHPSGIAELEEIEIANTDQGFLVNRIIVNRTARRIMDGIVYVEG
jgi:methylitaconate Delta-isomerase